MLSRLFNLRYEYESDHRYTFDVISERNRKEVEIVVRQWALDFRDDRIATLEAKVFAYEQIISKSNFAPMIHSGNIHNNMEALEG